MVWALWKNYLCYRKYILLIIKFFHYTCLNDGLYKIKIKHKFFFLYNLESPSHLGRMVFILVNVRVGEWRVLFYFYFFQFSWQLEVQVISQSLPSSCVASFTFLHWFILDFVSWIYSACSSSLALVFEPTGSNFNNIDDSFGSQPWRGPICCFIEKKSPGVQSLALTA